MTVHNIESFTWADWPGQPKHPGVRINRGRGWVFIPDSEVLALATSLADHLDNTSK